MSPIFVLRTCESDLQTIPVISTSIVYLIVNNSK